MYDVVYYIDGSRYVVLHNVDFKAAYNYKLSYGGVIYDMFTNQEYDLEIEGDYQ